MCIGYSIEVDMARGGKRPGAGAKKKAAKDKRVAILVRIKPTLRHLLDRQRKRNKQSLSREVEILLAAAVDSPPGSDDTTTKALCFLVAQAVGLTSWEGGNWRTNRGAFQALKLAIPQLLELVAPPESAPSDLPPFAPTSEALAGHAVWWIWNRLHAGNSNFADDIEYPKVHKMNEYPKIARALNFPHSGERKAP